MKIDKTELMRLAALPDDRLWAEVRKIASDYGISLPKETPTRGEMEQLRSALSGQKINAFEAMRLLNTYRKGTKK